MRKYWFLLIIPVLVFILLSARSCEIKKPTALELVADSIRIADSQAALAHDSSDQSYRSYETARATYDSYLNLPEPIKDSFRAAYLRSMAGADTNRPAGYSDTLRTTQTRSPTTQKKP
jgi:hypothetical protein